MGQKYQGLSAYERAKWAEEYNAYRNGARQRSSVGRTATEERTQTSPKKKQPVRRKKTKQKAIRKGRGKRIAIVTAVVAVAAIVLIAVSVYRYVFADFTAVEDQFTDDQLGIAAAQESGQLNVAVFGVDSYEEKKGRSDCTMILSVDKKNRQLKVVSILRDSYVRVEGHGKDKLTHAFAYGGARLALHTLNTNFDLALRNYIVLDYKDVVNMIDVAGGLDLEISDKERAEINRIAAEMDENAQPVTQTGVVHLNGLQATAYARIRKIDTENMRTQRQRIVIQALLEKCTSMGVSSYPKLAHDFLPYLQTNLSASDLTHLALCALRCDTTLREYVVPGDEDDAIGGSYDGFWCWRYDTDAAAKRLHTFLNSSIEVQTEK